MKYEWVTPDMKQYPKGLREIKNKPKKLYYVGNLEVLNQRCVSLVGSRTANGYGKSVAEQLASKLAMRGVTVVSGLAKGIDTCAHRGALKAGGNTAAVLGCGLDVCYPPENRNLMKEIAEKGLLITEYDLGTKAERYHFPNRNRIISGLSEITVVVQARNRSGSLITAELAAEQGREVMAVPGNIDSQHNLGTNKLIREGATMLLSESDIFEALGIDHIDEKEAKNKLSATEYEIFELLLKNGEMSMDEICMALGKSPAYVNPIVAVMEMKGFTFSEMGKIFLANV